MQFPPMPPTEEDRVWAGLSYAGAICCFCGLPSLLIFFLKRGESAFIRFHALQAFIFAVFWVGLFILALTLTVFARLDFALAFLLLLSPGIAWLYLMIQAFRGRQPHLPWIGDWLAVRITEER
jgi:uncharacterized membrane protein